jgi:hypothetical protein
VRHGGPQQRDRAVKAGGQFRAQHRRVTLLAGTEIAWLVVIGYFLWRLLT